MKKHGNRLKPLAFSKETLVVLNQGSLQDAAGGITPTITIATPPIAGTIGFTIGLTIGYTVAK